MCIFSIGRIWMCPVCTDLCPLLCGALTPGLLCFWRCLCLCSVASVQPSRLLCSSDSPGKNTAVGCHALLQGIVPTQGSNPCLLHLLHCRWILYHWATREAHFWGWQTLKSKKDQVRWPRSLGKIRMNHCLKKGQVILFLTLNLDTPLLHFLLLLGSITKLTKRRPTWFLHLFFPASLCLWTHCFSLWIFPKWTSSKLPFME